jgi:hypothetical protein
MQNPLLKSNNTIKINDTIIEITYKNILKYFKYVYVLTKINDSEIPDNFYNLFVEEKVYDQVSNNLMLKKVSINILKNKIHYNNMTILSKDILEKFNIFKYNLDDNNIIITILSSNYIKLENYLNTYTTTNFLENIYNTIVFNNFFKVIKFNINDMINNIAETSFWENSEHLISLNGAFIQRSFKFDKLMINDQKVNDVLEKVEKEDYLNSHTNCYTNLTDTLCNHMKNKFIIRDTKIFTKDNIIDMFNSLSEKNKFLLFANLLITKDYAHLVLNNLQILIMMKPIIERVSSLFRYLISYAWTLFYLNESIKKSHVKTTDEFIFDIDTASELPIYYYCHNNHNYNPYSSLLVNTTSSSIQPDNICGIPDYRERISQGIADLDRFKTNMNLFTTGDEKTNLFQDINFGDNIAITGSIMTACLQQYHPLLEIFNGSYKDKFKNYCNEYFPKSDIDMMIKTSDTFEYIEIVNYIYKQININICKLNPNYAKPEHTKLILNKKANFFVSEQFIRDLTINNKSITNFDEAIEYIRKNVNIDKDIRKQLNIIYMDIIIKPSLNDERKTKFSEFFDDNIEFAITVNKTNQYVTLIVNYKYNITSPHLLHNLELFQVRYDDFFATVAKFHLPCVRAYYNGNNVFMTPSCITAHLTYMNIDYKYFSGAQDPIEIINKYRLRGFGTWLSENEKKQYITYSSNIPFWCNMLNLNNQDKCLEGVIDINNMFFKPRLYQEDYYINCNPVDLYNRYNSKEFKNNIDDLPSNISHITPNDLVILYTNTNISKVLDKVIFNCQTISQSGNILKIKKWVINAMCDYMS